MNWLYRHLVRPLLFTQDPESIHELTMGVLGWASRQRPLLGAMGRCLKPAELPAEVLGLRFPNPVGLAAGMDKLGEAVPAWAAMGFGFVELGAVTWQAQPGNPRPRVFRAVADQAIVNRMGFNNDGAEALAERLRRWRAAGRWPSHPVGVNLGKSRVTPLASAAEDYALSFRALWEEADFFVVNVSSPNTPGLRQLQDRAALDEILAALQEVNAAMGRRPATAAQPTPSVPKPILVKVAPDLTFDALDEILTLAGPRQIAGLVATNTTLERPSQPPPQLAAVYAQQGGLSGRPLRARSTDVIRHLYRQTRGRLPIMGVGGIFTAEDAWDKVTAGACLIQLYTGLVFEGPGSVKAVVDGLAQRLRAAGLAGLEQAVGLAAGERGLSDDL